MIPFPSFRPRLLRLAGIVALAIVGPALVPAAVQAQQLPFSDYQGRRGLSPYTALGFQGNSPFTGDTLGAYQNIVRPQQLQAAQFRQQQAQARQIGRLQGQMQTMQRGSARPTTDTIRATGHSATFMNMSHYYPGAR
jgi:hypothetical protein